MKAKLISFIMTAVIGVSMIFYHALAEREISVFLNGKKIVSEQAPVIIDDSTYIPMRNIFESFGFDVEWNSEKKRIKAKKEDENYIIILQVGSTSVNICGNDSTIEKAPVIINNRVLLPLRAIGEKLDADVYWNAVDRAVSISKGSSPIVTQTSKKFNFQNYADSNFWSDSTWDENYNNYKNSADIFLENNKPSYIEEEEENYDYYDDGYDDGYGDGYYDALRRERNHRHKYGEHHYDKHKYDESQYPENSEIDLFGNR